jgi:hypothetical protein
MSQSNASKMRPPGGAPLGSKPLEAIGRALRAHYDDLLNEPLPPRFEDLLSRLEAAGTPEDDEGPAPKA